MESEYFPFLKDRNISSFSLAILMLAIFLVVTVYQRFDGYGTYGFAEEIGNVAASVASGTGFADTFGDGSGATAWCPPLYVLYYAAIFKLFGIKSVYAYWALYISRAILLSLTFYLLLKIDYTKRFNEYKLLLFPVFMVYGLLVVITKKCDDVFLQIFISSLIFFTLSGLFENKRSVPRWLFYFLCCIIPFTNISFFTGFLLVLLVGQLSGYLNLPSRQLTMAACLLIAGVLIWGMRNNHVLGKFIPFKSNLWFEVYLANVVDDDGISKWSNFRKYHPLGNTEVLDAYQRVGEVEFINEYKTVCLEYLSDQPQDFIKKIRNRSLDAFVFTTSQMDTDVADINAFSPSDFEKLQSADLIKMGYWVCMEAEQEDFFKIIGELDLTNKQPVVDDWLIKQESIKLRIANRDSIKNLVRTVLISLVPFLMLIFGLLMKHIRTNKVYLLTVVLYIISIGPYILISFLPRYQFFQMTFQVVMVFLGLSYILSAINERLAKA